jgi:hypothetical protein
MSRTDRILEIIDAGLQTPFPDPSFGEVSPVVDGRCARCRRVDPVEGSDWCERCRGILLGDIAEPPTSTVTPTPWGWSVESTPGSRPAGDLVVRIMGFNEAVRETGAALANLAARAANAERVAAARAANAERVEASRRAHSSRLQLDQSRLLFVGGPWDGRIETVANELHDLLVPVSPENVWRYDDAPTLYSLPIEVARYVRCRFLLGALDFGGDLMIMAGSERDAPMWLHQVAGCIRALARIGWR